MTQPLNLFDLCALIRAKCAEAGSQQAWAKKVGITPSLISDTLSARDDRKPSPSILAALGLCAVTRYVPVAPREPKPDRPRLPPSARLEPRDPKLFPNG
jgi:hypothetical protein